MTRKIYELVKAGQVDDAMKLQFRILELFETMLNPFEFPDGFRAATVARGFKMGRGRVPMTPAQEVDRAALVSMIQCILTDFGLGVQPPAEGCSPRSGAIGRDKIGQVVFEVLNELEQRGVIWTKR